MKGEEATLTGKSLNASSGKIDQIEERGNP